MLISLTPAVPDQVRCRGCRPVKDRENRAAATYIPHVGVPVSGAAHHVAVVRGEAGLDIEGAARVAAVSANDAFVGLHRVEHVDAAGECERTVSAPETESEDQNSVSENWRLFYA